MLEDILHKQSDYAQHDGERFMDAVQNARLVTDAERYYHHVLLEAAPPGICATLTCLKR